MIVVDTNLLACLLLPTPFSTEAEAVFLKDPEWMAPALIHSELRNVMLGAVRRKDIDPQDADSLLARASEIISLPARRIDGSEVFALALRSGCNSYDCEFVWLAGNLHSSLITADKKVLNAFPDLAMTPAIFLNIQ
jgi:predicted nucleic acid-binding protein